MQRFDWGSLGLTSIAHEQPEASYKSGIISALRMFLFSPIREACPTVCIPPGARLLLRDIPKPLEEKHGLKTDTEEVVFTETRHAIGFRDAIQFPSAKTLLLQQFNENQRVGVLSLSGSRTAESLPPTIPLDRDVVVLSLSR
jgi:hypothetical protein